MHAQLPLPFKLRETYTFDNFIEGDNALLINSLRQVDNTFIFLWGDRGTGKTHLLQATCQYVTTLGKTASYLPLNELHQAPPEIIDGLGQLDLVCIDDIESICAKKSWEEALFNLFNQLKLHGGQLIISGQSAPKKLDIRLADLHSRLNSGLPLNILPLDEGATLLAINKRAEQHGFILTQEVAHYLLTRFPRDLPSLWTLLDKLDHATLSAQKKLTVPFLKKMQKEFSP